MNVGFDFTGHIERICRDMIARLPELRHIDMDRVGVGFRQTRKAISHGMFASLTPLRFQEGSLLTKRRGRDWTIQRVFDRDGREMLYILNFYLPRFQNLSWREKLITVIHELWHVGTQFDGDLRRHEGRCYAHGSSKSEYDEQMGVLVDTWLAHNPPESLHAFLQNDFHHLHSSHGGIFGRSFPRVKLIPAQTTAGT